MSEERTKDPKQEIAIFRYGVISDFLNGTEISREDKRRLMKEKCARKWQIPYSEKTSISAGTIYGWIRDYKKSGCDLKSLYPKSRCDQGKSRAMDEDTCMALSDLKKKKPGLTVDQLIKTMQEKKLITPGIDLKPTTVYRFLNQNDLMGLTGHKPVDRRRFEAELPGDLWQSDVMHGPRLEHEGRQRKTYLIAIIDDHSRLIPYARFYLSETLPSYLDALYHALAKRGLPRKLYVDNGPAFRSNKLQYVTAALNIILIHSRPYVPEGRGKIERWFKTVRSAFLTDFAGNTLDELNDALYHWIDTIYHRRKHGSTGESPFDRFTKNLHCARQAPSNLMDYFRTVVRRKVFKDRTVTLNGRLFEAPVSLIGKRIELYYHDSDPDHVEVKWNNQSYGLLRRVDLNVNYRVKRDKNRNIDMEGDDREDYQGGCLFGRKGK